MAKKLLLADDSITIQKVVGITFAQEDFELTYVDNGEDAIRKVRDIGFDIVLADIIMPQKNGYEVCEAIKKDPQLCEIPVLLLAGTFETFDETRGKQAGADGYIIKPFESQSLIDKVNDLLKKKVLKPRVEIPPKPIEAPPKPPLREPIPSVYQTQPPSKQPPPLRGVAPTLHPRLPVQPAVPQMKGREFQTSKPTKPTPPQPTTYQPASAKPSVVEPPIIDKRMEPLLEFEVPSVSESPTSPEIHEMEKPEEVFPDSIGLSQFDSIEQPIELASPAEFIMEATGANEPTFEAPAPIEKKEDLIEVQKPPTFDFVSGESDLGSESSKLEEPSQLPQFSDLGILATPEETEFSQPEFPFPSLDQMAYKEPMLDKTIEPKTKEATPIAKPTETLVPLDVDFWRVREVSEETTSPPVPAAAASKAEPLSFEKIKIKEVATRIPEDQMEEIIKKVSENIIERIAWEIVPDMAERIIKEEIQRLTESEKK